MEQMNYWPGAWLGYRTNLPGFMEGKNRREMCPPTDGSAAASLVSKFCVLLREDY